MTTALEGGEGSASRPGHFLPPGKTRYPFYRRLGGPQGRTGHVRKISPPPGFDPRTVQPVAQSLYRLSYPAHPLWYIILKIYVCIAVSTKQILFVPSIPATSFGRTGQLQAFKYTILKTQNKMKIYFEFVRSNKLYRSPQFLCST